jgi:hypothetical protein
MRPVQRLVLASAIFSGCSWSNATDCRAACEKAVGCGDLHGVLLLSCGRLVGACFDDVAACADCIDVTDCAGLVAGSCDAVCRPSADGGP